MSGVSPPEPVTARDFPTDSEVPKELQSAIDAINRARNVILDETLESNDPTQLNGLRTELGMIGDAINNYLRRGDASGLQSYPILEDLQSQLEPLRKEFNFSKKCLLCSIVDTLFKQAPFSRNPSHALLLQKNIPKDQNGSIPNAEIQASNT